MMYEGALLLAADQVPLAEDDLLAPVVSRAIVTNMLYLQQDDAVKVLITEAPSPYLPLATFEMWCWSRERRILLSTFIIVRDCKKAAELSLCNSVVYNGENSSDR